MDRESIKSVRGERVSGTCEGIKEDRKYRKWLKSTSKSHSLWIFGGPGKGKTTMSVFLTEDLKELCEQEKRLLTFFFCDHGDENRSSAVAVLRGIIWQILKARPQLYIHAAHCAQDTKQAKHALSSRDSLWLIFDNILQDPRLGEILCIIDGLDECAQGLCLTVE